MLPGTTDEKTALAVVTARLDNMTAIVAETRAEVVAIRGDFQRFADRNGDRISKIELAAREHETRLASVEGDVGTLQADIKQLVAVTSAQAVTVGTHEKLLEEFQQIKLAVLGQLVGLIVIGGLLAWALLKP